MYNYVTENYSIIKSDYELELQKVTDDEIEEAFDGSLWLKGHAPNPTHEQTSELRKQYRREHIDDETAARSRKMANNTWTQVDEEEYLALDEEVTAYIEEHYPYTDEGE